MNEIFIFNLLENWGSQDSLLGFHNLLEWLAELRKALYLVLLTYKGCNSGTAKQKRYTGQGMGWGMQSSHALSGLTTSRHRDAFTKLEAL